MIRISNFAGMLPSIEPRMLPDGSAQTCTNARNQNGSLVPFNENVVDTTLPEARAKISKINSLFQGWDANVSVVPSPTTTKRVYVSGDGVPKLYTINQTYDLALYAPTTRPAVSLTSGDPDPDTATQINFVYTYVTELDEESPPSPLSLPINYTEGQVLQINGFVAAPIGRGIDRIRIYRTVTSFTGEIDLFYVGQIASITPSFSYSSTNDPIQEPIASNNYDPPPDGLEGFTSMPNGMIVGFVGRDLYFCEPYRPHAWPSDYVLTVDYDIVGLSSFGSTIAIMTDGQPYIAQGTHPEQMFMEKVEENVPCVSARGIVDLGYAAVYPSTDGLVTISQGGATIISRGLFTRKEWQALQPETFVAAQYEGRYAFIHETTDAGRRIGFLSVLGDRPDYITTDDQGLDVFFEIETGAMYVLETDGVTISRFDDPAAASRSMTYRTKLYQLPNLTCWGAARIDTNAPGAMQVDIVADGAMIDTLTRMNEPTKLSGGRLSERFEFEITGTATVTMFAIANNVQELM